MNTETGRLVDLQQDTDEIRDAFEKANGKSLDEIMDKLNLTPVPEELEGEARNHLNGRPEVMVDLNKSTPLACWAKVDQQRKKKNKRKIAQKSRMRNR